MKRLGRGLSIGALIAFVAACSAEGPQGELGDAPEISFSDIEPGEECVAGGQAILVDGEVSAVVCNGSAGEPGEDGTDGQDGADGDAPEVTVTRFDEHPECEAGGSLVSVTVDAATSDTVVCDGVDGDSPTIEVSDVDPASDGVCGMAGGHVFTVTHGEETTGTETFVCNGRDGVDGDTPVITVSRFVVNDACDEGGVLVTVVLGDEVQEAVLCDGEAGQTGANGGSPSISTATIDGVEDGVCGLSGGYAITVTSADGESTETVNVCNGTDGDAQLPTVTIDENPGECGTAGGVTVTIGSGTPFTVCNGQEGAQGEPGNDGAAIAVSLGAPADCEFGGYSLTIGENAPVDICNGAPGQNGAAGDDGMSPEITVTTLEANPAGVCPDGGVMLTITTASGTTAVPLCGASEPVINGLAIGFCNTQFPSTIEMNAGDSVLVFGQVYVELVTDLGGEMPDTFVAEVGYGTAGTTPDDASWSWNAATQNVGAAAGNNYEYQGNLTVDDAGIYPYLYRMRLYDEDEYTYCGLNDIVDLGTYDELEDAGIVDVAAAAQEFLDWQYNGETLVPVVGAGEATFNPGVDGEGNALADFIWYSASGGNQWGGTNWLESTEFFDLDGKPVRDRYYRFESDYSGYDAVSLNLRVQTSSTGADRIQIAAEYGDGSLTFLANPVVYSTGTTVTLEPIDLPLQDGAGEIPVAYRIYPYNAAGSGGTFRMHFTTFIGL